MAQASVRHRLPDLVRRLQSHRDGLAHAGVRGGDALDAGGEKVVAKVAVNSGIGFDCAQRLPGSTAVSRFLKQLALRRFERGLTRVHHAARGFQRARTDAETELLHHHGKSGGRQRHAVHPVDGLQHEPFQGAASARVTHPVVAYAQKTEVRAGLGGHAFPCEFVIVRHQYPVNSM